jgi:hypothetical protein
MRNRKQRALFSIIVILLLISVSCASVDDVEVSEILIIGNIGQGLSSSEKSASAALILFSQSRRRIVLIPIKIAGLEPDIQNGNQTREAIQGNFAISADYFINFTGRPAENLLEILEAVSGDYLLPDRAAAQRSFEEKIIEYSAILINNASFFLEEKVFSHILAVSGDSVPEGLLRKLLEMLSSGESDLVYMPCLLIDNNAVKGYFYEREYIDQIRLVLGRE